ncbi:hypothetical protein BW897_31880 [Bacillus cereus]|uniref:Uncharacterized protein n=1 Tax=Bacillus cereus TaxID=1396 RepID=A0A1S9T416_BACCE|nr:ETX/MTX2 family pore-forming toxin [Bacillus cereus]OOR04718.1 hypothetical protein BW897_31880 [Bacillus cereus]
MKKKVLPVLMSLATFSSIIALSPTLSSAATKSGSEKLTAVKSPVFSSKSLYSSGKNKYILHEADAVNRINNDLKYYESVVNTINKRVDEANKSGQPINLDRHLIDMWYVHVSTYLIENAIWKDNYKGRVVGLSTLNVMHQRYTDDKLKNMMGLTSKISDNSETRLQSSKKSVTPLHVGTAKLINDTNETLSLTSQEFSKTYATSHTTSTTQGHQTGIKYSTKFKFFVESGLELSYTFNWNQTKAETNTESHTFIATRQTVPVKPQTYKTVTTNLKLKKVEGTVKLFGALDYTLNDGVAKAYHKAPSSNSTIGFLLNDSNNKLPYGISNQGGLYSNKLNFNGIGIFKSEGVGSEYEVVVKEYKLDGTPIGGTVQTFEEDGTPIGSAKKLSTKSL